MFTRPFTNGSKFYDGFRKSAIYAFFLCYLCFPLGSAFSKEKNILPNEIQLERDDRSKKEDDKKDKKKKKKHDRKEKKKKGKKNDDKKGQTKKDNDKKDKPPKIKVFVCHKGKTIEISESALQAHLNHGDAAGACEDPIDFDGSITPYLPPVGKSEDKIGPELTALFEIFDQTQNAASNEIFTIRNGNLVLINIEAQPGRTDAVILFLANTYNIIEFVDNALSENNQLNEELITVLFPIDRLYELLENEDIHSYDAVFTPITNSGIILSQGDKAQQSDKARKVFEVSGGGIKIGVLSDSYNALGLDAASSNVRTGELPGVDNPDYNTPVVVLKDYPAVLGSRFISSDEGRAMLQIIHDVAPEAELIFRTGVISAGDMAEGIFELQAAGCDIIVDDITHYTEPFFKDGPIANAVDIVTSQGVNYFTSAGNFGNNSYEAQFNPATGNEANHDFNQGNLVDIMQKIHFSTGFGRIVLQWDDDFGSLNENEGAQVDLDIYIINDNGDTLVNTNRNNIGGDPFEMMAFNVNGGFAQANIVIHRAAGTENVNFKYIVFEGKDFKIEEHGAGASTITGHANAEGAITVGAVLYKNTPAFDTVPSIASFSSRGGTVVNGTPRNKPDISAPNGVNTTVHLGTIINDDGTIFNIDGDVFPNFFGTSASAPHAAASAALAQSAFEKFGVVGDVKNVLQETAVDMGTAGFDLASGAGFIQSDQAILTFAAPIPTIKELIVPEGIIPGLQEFDVTVNGEYLSNKTRVLFNGDTIPENDTDFINDKQIKATIPEFPIGTDPPLYAINSAITPNGNDGGTSEPLFFHKAPKKIITITADDKIKKYGEKLPAFTATILMDNIPIDSIGITADSLGLSKLIYSSSANSLSDVGFEFIRANVEAQNFDSTLLDFYKYEFIQGSMKIEKLPITIIPNDLTKIYGEKIDGITYHYNFDSTEMDLGNIQTMLDSLEKNYKSTFAGEDSIALVNRGRFLVNRGRFLVNGTAWVATNLTMKNRGRFLVNNNVVFEIDSELIQNLQDQPSGTISNRGRFLVNGDYLANGNAFNVDRGRFLVNDGALINNDGSTEGFSNMIVITDDSDSLVSSMYSINLISGLEVTRDSLHYIIPGAFLAPKAGNFEITYGVGNLEILPAKLNVDVDDKIIINGVSLPGFTSTISGYAYEENDSTVFSNISYSPIAYEGEGSYPIIPTLEFSDEENYVFDPSPIVPGTLTVVELSSNGRIAIAPYNSSGDTDLVLVNSDGSGPVTLLDGPEFVRDPQFSPDGNEIVFTLTPGAEPEPEYSGSSGHYYQLVESGLISWTDANTAANTATRPPHIPADYIGHLVTIADEAENDVISTLSQGDLRPWIGLTDVASEGTFEWVTGEPFEYFNWTLGEPNNSNGNEHYVEYFGSNKKWNDNSNSNSFTNSYVIEWEPAPPPPPIQLPEGVQQSIWKINTDGSGLTLLTENIEGRLAVYSPDGSKIAFIQNGNLALMNADGSNISTLESGNGSKLWPTFSPSGNEVFYTQFNIVSLGYNDVWKVNINSLVTTQVTSGNTTFYRSPEFLKDGSKIIYTRADLSEASGNAIMSMNPDGTNQTVIHSGNVSHASVSPDNSKLAFIKSDGGAKLYEMNVDGSNVGEIYSQEALNVFQPSWGSNPDEGYVFIPDPNFEQALIDLGFDSDGIINQQITKSDALVVTELYLSNPESNESLPNVNGKISDLSGIEAFANLVYLHCTENNLTNLDVSQNTALVGLYCSGNQLTALDVSHNTNLVNLHCGSNQLSELDVSQLPGLLELQCSENMLTSLNLSQNALLVWLACANNSLSSLNVSQNTALESLQCGSNQLTGLDLSQNTALNEIFCDANQLSNLDVSNNTALIALSCYNNLLTSLVLTQNTSLQQLNSGLNPLTELDVSQNTALNILVCSYDELTSLDVSKNTALTELLIDNNQLSSLDARNGSNENLTTFFAINNNLSCINVDDEEADHSSWEVDEGVAISNDCDQIVFIPDENFEQALIDLGIDSDGIINQQILTGDALAVSSLNVSNPVSNGNLPNVKDSIVDLTGIEAFVNLIYLECQYNLLSTLDLSQNTSLTELYCWDNQLSNLDLSQNTALEVLNCDLNNLSSLDLSNNTALSVLSCSENELTSLNVSNSTSLTELYCLDNLLTELDVAQSTVLFRLNCDINELTDLDLSNNPELTELWCANNLLESLDVSNGNNINVNIFYAINNDLSCIQVDEGEMDLSDWEVDEDVNFRSDCSNSGYSGPRTITGTVTSGLEGSPLPGLSIYVKGSDNGTISDINGEYSINVLGNDAILGFSVVGFETEEEQVGDRIIVDMVLYPGQVGFASFSTESSTIVQGDITVFPNPVVDVIIISHQDEAVIVSDFTVNVYDNWGIAYSLSRSLIAVESGFELDLSELAPKNYILHISDGKTLEIFRIQKQ